MFQLKTFIAVNLPNLFMVRTIIALAIGFYISRQFYSRYDSVRRRAALQAKFANILSRNGMAKDQAEMEVDEILSSVYEE